MPSASSSEKQLNHLLDAARPFLRGEVERVDPRLPSLVAALSAAGAGECSHRHDSFLEHLLDPVAHCGLFHSVYSNSYVNLEIFDHSTDRDLVRDYVGPEAEHLIHLFCVVPRHSLIYDDLLFLYSDAELVRHLRDSEASLKQGKGVPETEEWRKKLRSVIPVEGVNIVRNVKTGEDVKLSRRMVAAFLLLTMADLSDQYYGWQDQMFENVDGRLEYSGDGSSTALWPGDGKPGLWMNTISRIGTLYNLILREEILIRKELENRDGHDEEYLDHLVVPPIFKKCTEILDAGEQIIARDLYWEAMSGGGGGGGERRSRGLEGKEELLLGSIANNPYVGEPHVVLAQLYLTQGRFAEAEKEAEEGLRLLLEWATPWDKKTSWQGWVAWTRVLLMKAKEKSWPRTAWGIMNLGLVR